MKNGDIVWHKLLGKCLITNIPKEENRKWEIRVQPDGRTLMVSEFELEPLKEPTSGYKLKKLALATKQLAEIALKEVEVLEQKGQDDK